VVDVPAYQPILDFWFEELSPEQWWKIDPALDQRITVRFSDVHAKAARAELFAWRLDPEGCLAEILVLDQFSRNMHRGHGLAFANDVLALALAQESVATGADLALPQERRVFLYMPYMHSESAHIHGVAEALFRDRAPKDNHDFELRHKAIIDRFGRYPHRNELLGRPSTPQELQFLTEPGSRF
jgi:uncharacterized protein (DUF924 family)